MKFNNLTIENFCSIGNLELPLNKQGLVLILGRNDDAPKADSNGAGKSLPLDAFTWCLWGYTVRELSGDEVVNERVGKDCFVEVSFVENGTSYVVRRCRKNKKDKNLKPNDLVLFCNDEDVSGSSISDTQERINAIVGLDFITFCAMMPGAGVTVSELTDSQIKSLLEKILQTEILSSAYEKVREELKEVQNDIRAAESSVEGLNTSIIETTQQIEDLEERHASFEESKKHKLGTIQTKIDFTLEEIKGYDEVLQKASGVADKIRNAKERLEKAHKQQKEFQKEEETLRAEFNKKQSEWIGALEAVQTRNKMYEESLAALENLSSECPTCLQSVPMEHKLKAIQNLNSKIKLQHSKADVLTQQQARLLADSDKAKKPLAEKVRKAYATELLAKQDIESLQQVESSACTAAELKKKAKAGVEQLKNEKREVAKETNPFGSLRKEAQERLKQKTKEAKEVQERISVLSSKEKILSYWVSGFSTAGLRSFMLEHVTPVLNAATKKYADLLTDGEMTVTFHTKDTLKSGKSKERFNIQVTQTHGGSSYVSNSKGERARANLVIALALGDLAAMRANKHIPFRFLDEPFESIDESGTDAIVNLLRAHRDEYDTVFVITHKDDFKQLFTNKRLIVKKNGFSSWEPVHEK